MSKHFEIKIQELVNMTVSASYGEHIGPADNNVVISVTRYSARHYNLLVYWKIITTLFMKTVNF